MAYAFGSLVFTPLVQELQERYGSRRAYAKREESGFSPALIGPDEEQFLSERDSFYIATVGAGGWPYVQHRGGPQGFLKVIDERTIAFADFGGNKQFITTGNVMSDYRVAIILVDYPRQERLKILGRVRIFEGREADEWLEKVRDPDYTATIMRVFVIDVEASDWNCPQHITPRFTQEQIRAVLGPFERRMQALEAENEKLRTELTELRQTPNSA